MNKKNLLIAASIFTSLISSCNFLEVIPDNIATIDYAFRNKTVAEKFLFTCYSYRPPIGDVRLDPAMNGSDETWMFYGIASQPPLTNALIGRGFQGSTDPILNFWDGRRDASNLWQGIRDCNIFLENIEKVNDLPSYDKKRWIAEVKFLKAYYHYYLLKCFGPIPIVDVNLPVFATPEQVRIYREPIDKVVEYITNLMAEAAKDLPKSINLVEGTEAGRVDNLAALAVRAEVLLFAASPLFNGNKDYSTMVDNRGLQLFPQNYDPNKWKLAADACKQAIDSCLAQGKALYTAIDALVAAQPEPFRLQTTYRQAICDRWNKELIWGNTRYDNELLQKQSMVRIIRMNAEAENLIRAEWAPTLKTAEAYYSSNGVPINEDKEWNSNGWYTKRYRVRTEPSSGDEKYFVKEGERTVYLHYNREPRFYASLGFDKAIYFGNGYNTFPDNVKYVDFIVRGVSGKVGSSNYSITGYNAKKMHSFKNGIAVNTVNYEYFPFPIIRLADLYLMYAEAVNEFSGPSDEVYSYIDQVRARAGLKGVRDSWQQYSIYPDKPSSQQGLREIIQKERTIELALEGKRFWDLKRWKKIEEQNDQPRGWNITGENEADFYKVVNVAREAVLFTVKDYFWPIREDNLAVNPNLIQNYGW